MRGVGTWKVVAVAIATVLVVGAWGYLLATWPPGPPDSTVPGTAPGTGSPDDPTDSSSASSSGTEAEQGRPSAAVLGDSFSLESPGVPGAPWPELVGQEMGWELVTDAAQGSGYLVAGEGTTVPERVPETVAREPDVVLVAAGISDLGRPVDEIANAAEDTLVALREGLPEGELVLLSPFSNGAPGRLTSALAQRLEEVAGDQEVAYVDVTGLLPTGEGLLAPDGVHPSEAGHRHIAEAVAAELTSLGVDGVPGQR